MQNQIWTVWKWNRKQGIQKKPLPLHVRGHVDRWVSSISLGFQSIMHFRHRHLFHSTDTIQVNWFLDKTFFLLKINQKKLYCIFKWFNFRIIRIVEYSTKECVVCNLPSSKYSCHPHVLDFMFIGNNVSLILKYKKTNGV